MNDPSQSHGRGQDPRRLLSVAVDLSTRHNFFTGRTRDISVGGVFVATSEVLAIGTPLVLRMRILRRYFLVTARVAWELADDDGRPVGVGLRFVDAPRSMRAAIDELVGLRQPIDFEEPVEDDESDVEVGSL